MINKIRENLPTIENPRDETKLKKWLIISYVAADNDLTDDMVSNINAMETVGSDINTHLVTYIDQGPRKSAAMPFSGAGLLYINKDDDINKVTSRIIRTDGNNVNSGDWKTLMNVIITAITNHPASNIALFLNNHGLGFQGALNDDTQQGIVTAMDLRNALEGAQKATGKKIDIVGYSACLMSAVEVAYEIKDCANLYLASEEVAVSPGIPYGPILGGKIIPSAVNNLQLALKKPKSKITEGPLDFAKNIVNVCEQNNNQVFSFAAINLNEIEELKNSVKELAQLIQETQDKKSVLDAITNSVHFGQIVNIETDFRDLGDIINKLVTLSNDPKIIEASKKVKVSLDRAIIAKEINESVIPNATGLSIYAPLQLEYFLIYSKLYNDHTFVKETGWDKTIYNYITENEESGI